MNFTLKIRSSPHGGPPDSKGGMHTASTSLWYSVNYGEWKPIQHIRSVVRIRDTILNFLEGKGE